MLRKIVGLLLAVALLFTQLGVAAAQGGPTPKRINFAPGAISATRTGVLTMGGMVRYVLGINAGQTLNASVASGNNNVDLVIFGADGTVLISDHADASSWSGVVPSTQDYYIDVRAIDGTSANYTLTVTIPPDTAFAATSFHPAYSFCAGHDFGDRHRPGGAGRQQRVRDQGQCQPADADQHLCRGAGGGSLRGWVRTARCCSRRWGGLSNFSGELPSTQDYFITVSIAGAGICRLPDDGDDRTVGGLLD